METPHATPQLGTFRLERPLAIGKDASRFGAHDDAEHVELRALHQLTPRQVARLHRLRRVPQPGLLPIQHAELAGPGPHFIAVAVASGTLTAHPPRDAAELRAALVELADGLAAAHHVGVLHGALGEPHVLRGPRGYWLDVTATDDASVTRRAPELAGGQRPTAAADVWALGSVLAGVHPERGKDPTLDEVLLRMTAADPEARPTAAEIGALLDRTMAAPPEETRSLPLAAIPGVLGPYRLLEKLGEGGMGAVYRARAEGDERDVALKVLLPEWTQDKLVLARFRREARVLAQLSTPHIARFIAARRDGPWEYMVMEFVEGRSAHWLLQRRGAFTVPAALTIACDIARALAEVHALELVHRDVKPSNILIAADSDVATAPRAKLCDFGIVRPKSGDDGTALTRSGTPGTPAYMAPEQVLGEPLTPATDVYSLGATLFALIANRPPFVGDPNLVMLAQISEPPPALESLVPGVPPDVAAIVKQALSKDPDARHRDARALLAELELVRSGLAASRDALPQPIALEGTPVVYTARVELKSTPAELWPHVSNTERLNRAIGLENVAWSRDGAGDEQKLTGSFRAVGLEVKWKENPFEWIAPHRLGVVREYEAGPFEWMRSTVDLAPQGTGTQLTHTIEIRPRGILGRAAAGIEIGMRLRRALERTYHRIDASCQRANEQNGARSDPFEAPPAVEDAQRDLLHARMERARARGGDPHVLDALEDWILSAPPQAIGRIRPYVFADTMRLPRAETLTAFLLAASETALGMMWDILCPTCRIPSQLHDTLQALRDHGRCDACDLDFELDLARSVELVFRVEPAIRKADTGMYCIGGPAHSPHVVAQVRVPEGKRFVLDVTLDEGAYQLRGRGLPRAHPFRVVEGAKLATWAMSLAHGLDPEVIRVARQGRLEIALTNDLSRDVVVRLERATDRRDLVTAADATSNSLFRLLFPGEILAPEELIGISHVTLLCAEVVGAGSRYASDGERVVHRDLIQLQTEVGRAADAEGGALVKLQLDGVLAVFTDPSAATRASLRLLGALSGGVSASVHAGTAMLTTINQRLDYFGQTVFVASQLLREARPGEVVVSEETQRADPRTAIVLEKRAELVGMVQRHAIGMRYRARAA